MHKYTSIKKFLVFFVPALFLGASASHAKTMDFDITASTKMAYDDNITYVHTNALQDFVTNLETGFLLNQQSETHLLTLKADVIEQIFADHSNLDNTSEDLNLNFTQEFTEHDRLALVDILDHSYEPTTFEDAFARTNGHYSSLKNQTALSYTHDFTERLSGEVHYGDTLNDYSHGGPVDSSILYQAGTMVKYTQDSATIFNASYDYFRRTFENGPSAIINSVLTGVRRYFTPQFYMDLGAGPDFINSFTDKNIIEPHYVAALTDQVNANNNVSLTFEKQDTTDPYTEDLFNSWRTALNYYKQFNFRLSSYTSVFYGQGRYDHFNINENFQGVNTQLSYALTKKTKLSVGYSFINSLSNNVGNEYRKNYYYFSVTILF